MPRIMQFQTSTSPEAVSSPEWAKIACGRYHSAGLTKKIEVYTWGLFNGSGQLGYGDRVSRTTPEKVESLAGWPPSQTKESYLLYAYNLESDGFLIHSSHFQKF